MREIAVVTVARSDFGIYLPLLKALQAHPKCHLRLLASGMHLSPEFGLTIKDVENAGFEIFEKIDTLVSSDMPSGIAKSIGLGVLGFTQTFSRYRPDLLLVLGDRFDMLPAALAALPFGIIMAHFHGGEATEGLIDEAIRHSLTKLSHLHFVSTDQYARRVIQMGEEPWRVHNSGALGLDTIRQTECWSPEETASHFGFSLTSPTALITMHPTSLEYSETEVHISKLLLALDSIECQYIFTYPNADTMGRIIIHKIDQFCQTRSHCHIVKNAGTKGYLSLLNCVSIMIGNSSSGIIEAPSFELPVINIGTRQQGRLRAKNVLDCSYDVLEIHQTIQKGLDPAFRKTLIGITNPYGDGYAVERIIDRLMSIPLTQSLLLKKFHELPEIAGLPHDR